LAAVIGGLIDFLLRPSDPVSRWLLLVVVLGAWFVAARRWLWPAWAYRPSLLETAQRIERRYPQFGGRLASSIEFLAQSEEDQTAGSLALRRRVIAEAEAISAELHYAAALSSLPQRQGLVAATAMLGLVLVIAAVSFQTVAIAAGRLAMPWSSLAWPRWHHLHFAETPERLARGDDLELAVVDDNQRLPDSVFLEVRYDDGQTLQEEMKVLNNRMVYRIGNVVQSFDYRAYGGDDDTMPWQRLEVVEPLQVTDLQATIHPPAYAGRPWKVSSGVFTTLEGSRVALRGQADQPLDAGSIRREGTDDAIPLQISTDGFSFSLAVDAATPWELTKPGTYFLQLTSQEHVATDKAFQWDVRLTSDAPPSVAITSPADGAFATPNALLPVRGTAKDDLALDAVKLRFVRPGQTDQEPETVLLSKAEENPLLASSDDTRITGGDSVIFDTPWDLQAGGEIKAGDVLSWYVEASDFKPQSSQTPAARLTIISSEEMQDRLVQRQATALSQLAEALNLQRETRTQISSLESQWNDVQQWRSRDRDLLHSAELHQRQVQNLVGRTPTGAGTILANVLADLKNNRLDQPNMAARCEEILAAIDRLEREPLAKVATQFAGLLRDSRHDAASAEATREYLALLGREQEAIASTLEELLGKLSEWDSFQRIRRDLTELREDQKSLSAATRQLQAEMIAQGTSSQHKADSRQLGRRETELARRLEKLQQRLAEFAQRDEGKSSAAQKAAEVAETAGRLAIASKMREAARAADDLKLGQSLELQGQADEALAELLHTLSGRGDQDSEKSLQELRDLASSLDTLARQQAALAEELEKQASEPKEQELFNLADEQRNLEKRTNQLGQRLEKKQASEAQQSAQNAAGSMKQAAEAAQRKNAADAAQQARQAEQQLKQAKQQVNEQITQRRADLLREQMARLEQHIQGLLVRQAAAKAETERLLQLQQQNGQLTEAQTASVGDLAAEQEALGVETRSLANSSQLPGAFAAQLDWSADDMAWAARSLREDLSGDVVSRQQTVLDRLRMIAEALKPEPPPSEDQGNDSPMGENPPMPPATDGAPPPDVHDLAEVKLLRAMQAEINRRTAQLEARRISDPESSEKVQTELDALAKEQGKVAELALKLVQSLGRTKKPPGDSSEAAPAIGDEELLRQLDEALLPGNNAPNSPSPETKP
jgi:hypothetical protein